MWLFGRLAKVEGHTDFPDSRSYGSKRTPVMKWVSQIRFIATQISSDHPKSCSTVELLAWRGRKSRVLKQLAKPPVVEKLHSLMCLSEQATPIPKQEEHKRTRVRTHSLCTHNFLGTTVRFTLTKWFCLHPRLNQEKSLTTKNNIFVSWTKLYTLPSCVSCNGKSSWPRRPVA